MPRSLTFLLLICPYLAIAQVPGTEIWLVDLHDTQQAVSVVDQPINITRRPGYDNQPAFSNDGSQVLYTRMEGEATDIWAVDLAIRKAAAVTQTPESEYSPTPMAAGGFSVIRVEADGTQRIWAFEDQGTSPKLLFPDVAPAGYHAWFGDGAIGVFVLGEPHWLGVVEAGQTSAARAAEDIGRGLRADPNGQLNFIQKKAGRNWLAQWVPGQIEPQILIPMPGQSEDFAWTPAGHVLVADGHTLMRWRPGDLDWSKVADLNAELHGTVTRLAVSPDGRRLAYVAAE